MANLKQFVLVSAYLIALLLPFWHGAEAINYAWKLGERWLREKPQVAGNQIDPDLLVVGGSGGVSSGVQVTLPEVSCPTGGPQVCSETGTGTVTGYRVEHVGRCIGQGCVFTSTPTFTTNTITSGGCQPNETLVATDGHQVVCRDASGGGFIRFVASDPDSDGWPNERDCPFDKDKGARVCR